MENKNKKRRAIIIATIVFLILIVALFFVYKNRDILGVKTSSSIAKIFNPLETTENEKKELVQAGEDINKGDGVTDTGENNGNRIVKKALSGDTILGYASDNISYGNVGEITLSNNSNNNSFWNSIVGFFGGYKGGSGKGTNNYKSVCEDEKDNDGDGFIDALDPNCHIDGDLNNEYVPKHYSESANPLGGYSYKSVCEDGKDNDEDGFIDALDPNCHVDGDLNNEYVPKHYSESTNPTGGSEAPDLTAGIVSPTRAPINTEVALSSKISNTGSVDITGSFITLFTISDKTDGVSDNNTYMTNSVQPILAGASTTTTLNYKFEKTGTYYIRVCADKKDLGDAGLIEELNEDNNCGGWTTFTVTDELPTKGDKPECSDALDNDADGLIDALDPVCHVDGDLNKEYLPEYTSESVVSKECNDTIDNDTDGLIDALDPVCHVDGDLEKEYTPNYDSESQVSFECNDTIDNDKDNFIDNLDPNCHLDGDIAKEYVPTNDSESESPASPNVCLDIEQNPITFTDEEKAQLDELLRKFYLISPTLKSESDVSLVYNDIYEQQNFINQLDSLINECYAETSDPNYTGPQTKYGNPWYNYNTRGSYVSGYSDETKSSYCKNDPTKNNPHNFDRRRCPTFKTQASCERYMSKNWIGTTNYLATGCTWVETINLVEYETLLNIW